MIARAVPPTVTRYPVMAAPPSETGGRQDTVTPERAGAAATPVGPAGTPLAGHAARKLSCPARRYSPPRPAAGRRRRSAARSASPSVRTRRPQPLSWPGCCHQVSGDRRPAVIRRCRPRHRRLPETCRQRHRLRRLGRPPPEAAQQQTGCWYLQALRPLLGSAAPWRGQATMP